MHFRAVFPNLFCLMYPYYHVNKAQVYLVYTVSHIFCFIDLYCR